MNFTSIEKDTTCDCLKDTFEDHDSKFALKINKNRLRDNDFKSYWEKGRRNKNAGDCKETCSLKGQSLSIIKSEEDIKSTLKVYKDLFKISPGYKPYCAILKLKENSGVVKLTPSKINPLHCDFYKSDKFSNEKIELVKTIPLSDV